MLAEVIGVVPGGGRVGRLGLHEPDVLPDFFWLYGFVQVFADEQRIAQLVVTETAAGALHGVLALTVATDDPAHPLGSDAVGVVLHLYQDEFAVPAVGLVHVEDGVGGGTGTSEGVENDVIFITSLFNQFLQKSRVLRKVKANISPDLKLLITACPSVKIFSDNRGISCI